MRPYAICEPAKSDRDTTWTNRFRSGTQHTPKVDGKAEELTISLERAVIRVTSVKQEMLPHAIGYIRISQFQNRTGSDLVKAISKLQSQEKLKGLILDLRNNPGGVLSAAVEVVDAFISKGLVVTIKGRDEFLESEYEASNAAVLGQEPIVILINGGSASASEIVWCATRP